MQRHASDERLDAARRPFLKTETKQRMKRIRDQVIFWPWLRYWRYLLSLFYCLSWALAPSMDAKAGRIRRG